MTLIMLSTSEDSAQFWETWLWNNLRTHLTNYSWQRMSKWHMEWVGTAKMFLRKMLWNRTCPVAWRSRRLGIFPPHIYITGHPADGAGAIGGDNERNVSKCQNLIFITQLNTSCWLIYDLSLALHCTAYSATFCPSLACENDIIN